MSKLYNKIIETERCGIFIGQMLGPDCIKISIPAQNDTEWTLKTMFLDLPSMNKEVYDAFIMAMIAMKELFPDEEDK